MVGNYKHKVPAPFFSPYPFPTWWLKRVFLNFQQPNSFYEELSYLIVGSSSKDAATWRSTNSESRRHILSLQTGEAWTPRYPAKTIPAADPELNPEPATNMTEQLTTETVHGHAPIHSRSVNPRLTLAPIGERRLSVTAGPLGAPCVPNLYSSKGPSAHFQALKQDVDGGIWNIND